MTWPSDVRCARGSEQEGFSLFEVIIVLAILGLMTALIASSGARISPAMQARAVAQEISGALRAARSEAMMSNRRVAFVLDLSTRSYRWGETPRRALSSELKLSVLTSRDLLAPSGSAGLIRFDPDGGSSGGRITIEGSGVVWRVGVDWLSGRVSIAEQSDEPH